MLWVGAEQDAVKWVGLGCHHTIMELLGLLYGKALVLNRPCCTGNNLGAVRNPVSWLILPEIVI